MLRVRVRREEDMVIGTIRGSGKRDATTRTQKGGMGPKRDSL